MDKKSDFNIELFKNTIVPFLQIKNFVLGVTTVEELIDFGYCDYWEDFYIPGYTNMYALKNSNGIIDELVVYAKSPLIKKADINIALTASKWKSFFRKMGFLKDFYMNVEPSGRLYLGAFSFYHKAYNIKINLCLSANKSKYKNVEVKDIPLNIYRITISFDTTKPIDYLHLLKIKDETANLPDSIKDFFPICGVILGRTSVKEKQYNLKHGLNLLDSNVVFSDLHDNKKYIDWCSIGFEDGYCIPRRWSALGFNPRWSVNEAIEFFKNKKYSVGYLSKFGHTHSIDFISHDKLLKFSLEFLLDDNYSEGDLSKQDLLHVIYVEYLGSIRL